MKMVSGIGKWSGRKLPRNLILEKPLIGGLIFLAVTFLFTTLYRPLHVQGARSLSIPATMAAYCIIMSAMLTTSASLLKLIPYFSGKNGWTILREILSVIIVLLVLGIAVYFAGFLIEGPGNRWNIITFLDSLKNSFLIGIVPFAFFSLVNYRYIFFAVSEQHYNQATDKSSLLRSEELIHIESQLKKEDVSFYPSQLLYAESDGNYVVFYLAPDDRPQKKIVRNSITNIEGQLSSIPYIMRTHRAFIVNLRKVTMKNGNSLGYRLKVTGIDAEIPVSRQNTVAFDKNIKEYE
ncbi:MAG: LytTR family DNA-binding domain-containing protein [Bacteroidales bacterium]